MRHNQNVLTPFQFHDNRLKPDHDIAVRFTAEVPVVVLVFIALGKVLGVFRLDFSISETVADARVELVEGFPFEFLKGQEAGGLDGALEGRGPDCELAAIADGFCD
jgi:hypothetical protein